MPISATGNSGRRERGFTSLWRSAEHGFTLCRRSAEHGFTLCRRSAEHGFTLIELLVVLAILGAMSAVVVLALPDPRGRLVDEAERFAARAVAARDNAIVTARTTRMAVDAGGYGFQQRADGQWLDLASKPLMRARWADGTRASAAQVEFDPTGLAAPEARVVLQRGDERVDIAIGADGGVHVGK